MNTISDLETQTNQTFARLVVEKLVEANLIQPDTLDNAIISVSKALSTLNSRSGNVNNPQTKPKRPMSAYNIFIKENSAKAREELGEAAKGRGAIIRHLGPKWKGLNDEERIPYIEKALALKTTHHVATPIKTKKKQKVKTQPDSYEPPANFNGLLGPYLGTVAYGPVKGTRSFKTIEKAYKKMMTRDEAAVILRMKNGKYTLRMGFSKSDAAASLSSHPPFVYENDAEQTQTWVRPEAVAHFDRYGPFTSQTPFDSSKSLSDNTTTLLDIVQDLVPQTELDDNNEEYDADLVEITFKRIDIKDSKYWMFANTGHLLTYHRGQDPVTDDYTGKRYFNNQLMDAGVLPEIYIDYLT
jgi:hypothetical protein